jgi:hypothetical protein
MDPAMLHDNGTCCTHAGDPQPGDPPRCPAGLPITHVSFNGTILTIEQAHEGFARMADALVRAWADLFRGMFAILAGEIGGPRAATGDPCGPGWLLELHKAEGPGPPSGEGPGPHGDRMCRSLTSRPPR